MAEYIETYEVGDRIHIRPATVIMKFSDSYRREGLAMYLRVPGTTEEIRTDSVIAIVSKGISPERTPHIEVIVRGEDPEVLKHVAKGIGVILEVSS